MGVEYRLTDLCLLLKISWLFLVCASLYVAHVALYVLASEDACAQVAFEAPNFNSV